MIFESDDDFYFLQILKRKKEHPNLGRNSTTIHTYYINSIDQLMKLEDEIINLCKFHNARAYINLNKRSYENLAFQTLKKVTDIIMNKDYSHVKHAFNSVCGAYSNTKSDKKWIVDIDYKNNREINKIVNMIDSLQPEGPKFIDMIETKNGYHVITKSFNRQEFTKQYPEIDIQINNPTVLFIP